MSDELNKKSITKQQMTILEPELPKQTEMAKEQGKNEGERLLDTGKTY